MDTPITDALSDGLLYLSDWLFPRGPLASVPDRVGALVFETLMLPLYVVAVVADGLANVLSAYVEDVLWILHP